MDTISTVLSVITIVLSCAILWEFKTANWYAHNTYELMALKSYQSHNNKRHRNKPKHDQRDTTIKNEQ